MSIEKEFLAEESGTTLDDEIYKQQEPMKTTINSILEEFDEEFGNNFDIIQCSRKQIKDFFKQKFSQLLDSIKLEEKNIEIEDSPVMRDHYIGYNNAVKKLNKLKEEAKK